MDLVLETLGTLISTAFSLSSCFNLQFNILYYLKVELFVVRLRKHHLYAYFRLITVVLCIVFWSEGCRKGALLIRADPT